MGIQINGNTNNINAGIGSLSIEDLNELDIVGVATASNFKTGSSNLHSTGLTVGNNFLHTTGINVGTGATIHVPATNTLTFGTNSNERLRILSDGRIIIGATSGGNPDTDDLIVSGSGKRGITVCSTNGSETRLTFADGLSGVDAVAGNITYTHSNDSMDLYTATTRRLRIQSDGRMLLGTTDANHYPDRMFTINRDAGAGIELRNNATSTGQISFSDTNGSGIGAYRGYIQYQHNNGSMHFATQSTERVRITPNQVLIGTTTSSGYTNRQLVVGDTSTASSFIEIRCSSSGTGHLLFADSAAGDANNYTGYIGYTHTNNSMTFHTNGGNERVRINSDGDLMVGTTSDVSNVVAIFGKNHNNTTAISVENTDTNSSSRIRYEFKGGSSTSYIEKYNSGGWYFFNGTPSSSNPNVGFYGSSSWISLRLRPGDRSGNDVAHIAAYWGTSNGLQMEVGGPQSGTFKAIRFTTSHYGGERGYIGVTLGGTSYNSSSDYRMKQDVIDLTGAIDRVKSFKPKRFKWKEDPTYTVDGFLAHEASTVVPESVVGEKDAVDSNGDPEYQVMDNSKLVPVLTAALKEAIAKIEILETKVAALEGS